MATGPTRTELQIELNERQRLIEQQRRELDLMRKELQGRLDAQRIVEENSHQLYLDRERLTATVEVLSRRIASDGIRPVMSVENLAHMGKAMDGGAKTYRG